MTVYGTYVYSEQGGRKTEGSSHGSQVGQIRGSQRRRNSFETLVFMKALQQGWSDIVVFHSPSWRCSVHCIGIHIRARVNIAMDPEAFSFNIVHHPLFSRHHSSRRKLSLLPFVSKISFPLAQLFCYSVFTAKPRRFEEKLVKTRRYPNRAEQN